MDTITPPLLRVTLSQPAAERSVSPVNLLWTGGWDSTYRLLDLVINQRRSVEPHYIVDPDRPGTLHELHAMRSIRKRIARDYPERGALIRPTRVTLLDSIAADGELTRKHEHLKARAHLGSQYDWLARYIRERQLDTLELCIHADDRAESFVRDYVEQVTIQDGDDYWQIRCDVDETDIGLFARFRFPILKLTKTQMRRNAEAAGFGRIMALTWFCHTPVAGRPCGVCNPCRYTIDEGLSDRLPGRALLRNRFAGQMRMAHKISGPFYRTLGALARPFIQRERKRRGMAVS